MSKVQLPDPTDPYVAIQKYGGKVHLSMTRGNRALCSYRITAATVTGTRDRSVICDRCAAEAARNKGNLNLFPEVDA